MASLARQGEQPAQEVLPPRTLLWPAIKARLEPLEVREVKALIGAEAVEDNETHYAAIQNMCTLVVEARAANAQLRERIQELPSSSGALPSLPQQNSAPSRQAVEVLQSQIKYFVERIQEAKGASVPGSVPPLQLQAAASSTSEAAGLVASTPREKEILQFISGPGRPQSSRSSERFGARPLSARPASSRPSTAASCSTAGQSAASTAGVLDSLQGRLSLFTLDSVLQQLRDALVDEAEALSADHEYVEVCLREAAEERLALEGVLAARRTGGARPPTPSQGSPEQPSVEDLREYKARLQATWLAMEGVEGGQQQPRAPSRRFAARLRGAVGSEDAVAEPSFRRGGRVVPAQGSSKAGTAAGIMEDLEELFG